MPMSRISESNKMTWIHQLYSLEANYKSQGRPELWMLDTSNEFLGVLTPTTLTVAAPVSPYHSNTYKSKYK